MEEQAPYNRKTSKTEAYISKMIEKKELKVKDICDELGCVHATWRNVISKPSTLTYLYYVKIIEIFSMTPEEIKYFTNCIHRDLQLKFKYT